MLAICDKKDWSSVDIPGFAIFDIVIRNAGTTQENMKYLMMMISQFNCTSTPKGSYRAKKVIMIST